MDDPRTIEKHLDESRAAWVPPGSVVEIHGRVIPGGMIYTGPHIAGLHRNQTVEPALINPRLKATATSYARMQDSYAWYAPSYSRFNPAKRAAYLDWLAAERPVGESPQFIDLFVMGLERRILFDARHDETVVEEIPLLLAETRRLLLGLEPYRLMSLLTKLEDFTLMALAMLPGIDLTELEPPLESHGWSPPLSLLLALGAYAANNRPLPASLAYAWVMSSSESRVMSVRMRCSGVFDPFFENEYHRVFGDGFRIRPNSQNGSLTYKPVNPTFGGVVPIGRKPIPHVGTPGRQNAPLPSFVAEISLALADFVDHIPWNSRTPVLTTYAYFPEQAGPLEQQVAIAPFVEILDEAMGANVAALIEKSSFMDAFPEISATITPNQAASLSLLLERLGYGIEPDPVSMKSRFLRTEELGLYRMEFGPDPYYADRDLSPLLALLSFWSYVAAAGGPIETDACVVVADAIAEMAKLEPFEWNRLYAHALWLGLNPARLSDARHVLKKAGVFPPDQTALLVTTLVALEAPPPQPCIKALERVYKSLGIAIDTVHTDLHQIAVGWAESNPANDESTIRSDPAIRLDHARIEQVRQQTSVVSGLLHDLFEGESASATPDSERPSTGTAEIDPFHELARRLATQSCWPLGDIAALCHAHGLMAAGAIETINDRAIALGLEPPIECDDDICEIDQSMLKELLAHD